MTCLKHQNVTDTPSFNVGCSFKSLFYYITKSYNNFTHKKFEHTLSKEERKLCFILRIIL